MKLKSPHLWIGVFSAIGVLTVAVVDTRKTSPGDLTTVHGRIPELAGSSGCADCHGGWTRTMTSACLDCHEVIAGQLDIEAGLHGVLDPDVARRCGTCHAEHHGAGFAIVNAQSFRMAGIPDPEAFDHRRIGFPMDGRHLELTCVECHENADVEVLAEGQQRYLGLDKDCASCHEDAHEGRMRLACASCHGQTDWERLDSLDHDRFLPLVGGHGDIGCRTCHGEDDLHSLESLGGGLAPGARTCRQCHNSPHRRPFMRRFVELADVRLETGCVVCHEAEHTSFRDEALTVTAEQHACSGFELDVPHEDGACDDCHAPEVDEFAARYPMRKPDDCAACHDDPHGGQFDEGPFAAAGCVGCHERTHFEPHAFTVELHADAAFELTGTHLETACEDCHTVPGPDLPRTFHGTPSLCDDCHDDAHEGYFADRLASGAVAEAGFAAQLASDLDERLEAALEVSVEQGECAACHLTTTFDEVPADAFHHGAWTGFPAEGAHAQTDCETCHPRADEPDELGRRFGRVEEHFGTYEGCVTCHVDPHRGLFDKRRFPARVEGRTGCARCHVETSFRTFPDGFDHRRWTDFPLTGAHAELGCSECHEPLRHPDAFGRTWAHADGRACADCHADPHQGQFRTAAGATRCERCHESTDGFGELSFHHDRDSRFRLGDAHEGLACSECHKPRRAEDGTTFVRYRPMGRECVDCHGEHDDPLRRATGRRPGSNPARGRGGGR